MQVHFILLVGARAVLLLQRFGKEDDKAWILPPAGQQLHDTLAAAFKERPAAPIRVMIDCRSLDLRREGLPPVNPIHRRKIVGRQGTQHFAKSFLRGAGSWRDGSAFNALHAACEAEPHLEALVQQLHKLPNTVEFLSFFPAEWSDYAETLFEPAPRPWSIALVLSEAMGLRQILLKDGKAAFTRLQEDCVPSLGLEALADPVAANLRSLRDFLPRLDASASRDVPARLFVPSSLEALGWNEQLRAMNCRVVALKAPHAALLPPEWESDLVWAGAAGEQHLPLVPLMPFWMKERAGLARLRQVAVVLMMGFGMAGIYTGSSIMFGQHHPLEPALPPAAPVAVEAPPPPEPAPPPINAPTLKLDAVIYNSPDDWSVWINGEKFSSAQPANAALRVTGISSDGVAVHWDEGGASKDYMLKQENAAQGVVR